MLDLPFKRCGSVRRGTPKGWLLLALFAVLALHGVAAPPAASEFRHGHRSPSDAQHKQSLAALGAVHAARTEPPVRSLHQVWLGRGLSPARRLLQQNAPLEPLVGGAEVRSLHTAFVVMKS